MASTMAEAKRYTRLRMVMQKVLESSTSQSQVTSMATAARTRGPTQSSHLHPTPPRATNKLTAATNRGHDSSASLAVSGWHWVILLSGTLLR